MDALLRLTFLDTYTRRFVRVPLSDPPCVRLLCC
jgi:hypothetical protein